MQTSRLFLNATVIDGTGRQPMERGAICVSPDGRIAAIDGIDKVRAKIGASEYDEMDLDGKFVMPGMIDCHFHGVYEEVSCYEDYDLRRPIEESAIYHAKNAQTILEAGFTSAREVGSRGLVSVSTSKLIEKGILRGPRLVPGGRILSTTGGLTDAYGHWVDNADSLGHVVDGELELRKAAREQIKYGTKCIKVEASGTGISTYAGSHKQTMTEEEMKAVVHEARRNGIRVACHAQGTESIKNAVRAGVTTVEHGSFLDEEGVKLMLDHGTILTPTISVLYLYINKGPEVGVPDWVVEKFKGDFGAHIESFKMAIEAGIPMVVGSDSGHAFNPQNGIALELEMMVDYGYSPMAALQAATAVGAKAAGLSRSVGTLEEAKLADFLVLDGDPLADIAILQDPRMMPAVYQGGVKKGGYTFNHGGDGLQFMTASASGEHEHAPFGGECMIPYEDDF
jgi:imidazolonepropionase-like amidohydrolase